jgi:putative Mg2+ transporter-C (MgtC) family protein
MNPLVSFDSHQLLEVAHIALAMLLGAILGIERELAHKPAGLRTHMLVAGSAALLVALGDVVIAEYNAPAFVAATRADPLRILSAIITGVSFLGAGTIIRRTDKDDVEGLTTAASVLMAAGIGAATALAQTIVAIGATVLVVFTLRILGKVEVRLGRRG